MKKSKAAKLGISLALALSLALNVFASGGSPAEAEALPEVGSQQAPMSSPIVSEEVSRRGKYEKHFICEDGSFIAATYPYAVHEKNENGEWIDIDNSLALEDNRIENQSAANRVSFAPRAEGAGRIARLENDGHTLEWSLSGRTMKPASQERAADFVGPMPMLAVEEQAPRADAQAKIEPAEKAEETNEEKLTLDHLVSSVMYEDALGEGIDVRYTVLPERVKEDIILKSPSGFRSYAMHVGSEGLTAEKREDNSVEFVNEKDEVIFTICTPYMFDAADERSYEIEVEVSEEEGGYRIEFRPDMSWLNAAERIYPVTIDPFIGNDQSGANYDDTYIHQGDSIGSGGKCGKCGIKHNTKDRMYAGLKDGSIHRAIFKIKNMPSFPAGTCLSDAVLTLYYTSGTSTGGSMSICKNLDNWGNDTVTFETRPMWLQLETRPYQSGSISFWGPEFLAGIRMMYSGEPNYGFMVKAESETNKDYNAFYTSNYATATKRPLLRVNYQTAVNVENGTYFIRNVRSGKYLDAANSGGAGTKALQWHFTGATNQQWKVTKQSDGYYKLTPAYNSGLALEVKGGAPGNETPVQVNTDNGGKGQRWAFFAAAKGYKVMTKCSNNAQGLTVKYASLDDGGEITQHDYLATGNDQWELEKAGDTDNDGIMDFQDMDPNTPYRTATILLHGRTSNSEVTWGLKTNIPAGQNNHYNSSLNAAALNGKVYTAVASQSITGTVPNQNGVESPVYLGNQMISRGYKINQSLFAFNYPNEDAVIHSAKKLQQYVTNLVNHVRANGTTEMKSYFYRTKADYNANNYKINLVAHSMGGVVSRYYIENLGMDDHVDKLVTIDTPHWGSGYADVSCEVGTKNGSTRHIICDHDLHFNSAMNGGTLSASLQCNNIIHKCLTTAYQLTPELKYFSSRHTRYYAIAGIDYNAVSKSQNDYTFEMPTNYTTYSQIVNYMTDKGVYKFSSVSGTIKLDPKGVGDNMVGFMSQIGWTENSGASPNKRIAMEKIFIDVDTDGGNGGEIIGLEALNMFHSKVNCRIPVCNKVIEYLRG